MNSNIDPLDIAGVRARAHILFFEAHRPEGHVFYAAGFAEALARWIGAGQAPGMMRSFMPGYLPEWLAGETDSATAEIEFYVENYWPAITGAVPMPAPGWTRSWNPSPEQAAELTVEIALHQRID